MLDDSITTRSLDEREAMKEEYGTTQLPLQDLCYATYTSPDGKELIVDVLGTDESEQVALLSYLDETTSPRERRILVAERDQSGEAGTWLWTAEQLEAAKKNPVRLSPEENDFRGAGVATSIQIAPIHKDRRVEILMLGLQLNKSDEEVQERLRVEGFDTTLPPNYRIEQGEMELLKHWLPDARTPDK